MKIIGIGLFIGLLAGLLTGLLTLSAANAAGWGSIHKYVKPSGKCAGQEVLASYYWEDKHTASGEAFDPNGNTAAARTWPLGTTAHRDQSGRTAVPSPCASTTPGLTASPTAWAPGSIWRAARRDGSACTVRNMSA